MKTHRILFVIILLCFVFVPCFGAYTFGGDDFSLTLAPMDPLFKESRAYPFSNNIAFRYLFSPADTDFLPTDILATDAGANGGEGGYIELPFKDSNVKNNKYWNLKSAINIGFLRFQFRDIVALEAYIHGGLNTVFGAYGGVDVIGFDGQYGAGFSLQLFEQLTFRFGFHHFSGHWGDEILKDFLERHESIGQDENGNPIIVRNYDGITEYTRNNSYLFDLSYQPVRYIKFLVEAELPVHVGWVRPAAHVPADTIKNTSEESPDHGKPLSEHIYNQEGLPGHNNNAYPSSYKAWRIGLGIEAEVPIPTVGCAYLAADMQLHQDGKINLRTLKYEQDRPWDMEFTVALGLSLQELPNLPDFTIELAYHDGRFPLLNFFFQRSRYFSAGLVVTI